MDGDEAMAFARQFQGFLDELDARLPRGEPPHLVRRFTEHLGRSPQGLPVVTDSFRAYDHPNVQIAIDRYLGADARSAELIGLGGGSGREYQSFSELIDGAWFHGSLDEGAVDYVTVPTGIDEEMTCVRIGVYLIADGVHRFVVLMRAVVHNGPPQIMLETLGPEPDVLTGFLAEIRTLTGRHNVFRGKIISVEPHEFGHGLGPVKFHARPAIERDDVILPAGLLEAVERQVIGVAVHRDRLLAAGHHLKRGVLLFGPPGSGKTHTVRYLMSRLPDVTIVVVTGLGLHHIREACALARLLPPALVVVEDVDLVAESRALRSGLDNPLLFQLLNEMDGVAGDSDVAFVLTTNRADLLEPALAQRPGRVDLAVNVPLPDERARTRLLALYGPRLVLDDSEVAAIVAETNGVPASFFAEVSRRAELLTATGVAAGADGAAGVTAVRAALDEMRASRDALGAAT